MDQNGDTEAQSPPTPEARPVGGTEFSWCKAVPIGTGVTVLSLLLSKPPQISVVQNALHKLQNSHPILRSKIHLDPSNNTFHFLIPPTPTVQVHPFDITSTATIIQSQSNGHDPFHALLEHEMNQDTWRDYTIPSVGADVLHAAVYNISLDRFAVFLRLHTAACDRAAAVGLLKELLRLVAGGAGDEASGEKVNSPIEDLIPEGKTNKPF